LLCFREKLDSAPGYELWRSQFSGAAGAFTIELPPCSEENLGRFVDTLELFGLGTSWGGFDSLIMPAVPHHLRAARGSLSAPRLVRLHIGLESADDLIDDLDAALATWGDASVLSAHRRVSAQGARLG
jgi:cysteine-S-conjugate beta-lyase